MLLVLIICYDVNMMATFILILSAGSYVKPLVKYLTLAHIMKVN